MKIGIAGAGAVGCTVGGSLSKAGYDVIYLARGKHFEQMQQKGLTIETDENRYKVYETFTQEIEDFRYVDVVVFSFKSHDTYKMANALKQIIKSDAVILTLQNGVDNEEVLIDTFGVEKVFTAATYLQAFITSPSHVQQIGKIRLVIGSLDKLGGDTCEKLKEIIEISDIDVRCVEEIMHIKWKKLFWNVTFNPLTAIVKTHVGEVLDNESLYTIAKKVCIETIHVANQVEKDLCMHVDKMVDNIFEKAEHAREHHTSMLQDRLKNKQMEIESMCGYIVKKGLEVNVPTPTLEVLYLLLLYIEKQD